ncbi:MAG: thioredoxin domain-containing protein [Acidobacteria bacterium]|nr:thioredoxin domain-containing protein [Acidobacteriota bacterium]
MKKFAGILILCLAASGLYAADADPAGKPPRDDARPIVEIDGVTLTMSDFEAKRPGGLFQARNNYYEAEKKAIDEFVNQWLLEREAAQQKTTPAELLDRQIKNAGFAPPSDETLRVYYEGVDTTEPFENVRDKIIEAIRTRRIARTKKAYLESLRNKAKIVLALDPPRAPISLKTSAVRGLPDSPVNIVEFADYECPYCQQIQPVVEKLLKDYGGKVAFAFKDFPLPMHTHAQKAAEAARCAGAQGKYWAYHDALFANHQYDVAKLKGIASDLKLDVGLFDTCLDSGTQGAAVQADFDEAQVLGLPGTPAFFVNGRLINPNGTVSYDILRQLVDEELALSKSPARQVATTASTAQDKK